MDDSHLPPRLCIDPPLFNSANPWATTLEHLRSLYTCSATGAVTTRTALLSEGFPHDEGLHQYAFFETATHGLLSSAKGEQNESVGNASLNNLGYSPIPLDGYLRFIQMINEELEVTGGMQKGTRKPFIVSVTGTPDEVAECYRRIARCQFGSGTSDEGGERGSGQTRGVSMALAMEVNLSCPNIPGKPPPAYEGEALKSYVRRVSETVLEVTKEAVGGEGDFRIPWGVKTPPYTHAGQFEMFVSALRDCAVSHSKEAGIMTCPISFVTATNTLGSCLLLDDSVAPALPGLGIGGMAGAPLHPLALGNVATLRRLLGATPETKHVALLGIGGVGDAEGYKRMRSVGASAVGVGTALGIKGLEVFEEIERGVGGVWDV